MRKMQGLDVFVTHDISVKDAATALRMSEIKKVVCCALGPKGNNIEQAATRWLKRMGVDDKGEVILRDTPEKCLELARSIKEPGVVAVFWTCAVYYAENVFFFSNPDVFPFFFQEEMLLDAMQLATRVELAERLGKEIPMGEMRVASHPSPAPLVKRWGSQKIVLKNSNAAAAEACAQGETELCVTTESARARCGLVELHSFGSPNMVFFGGLTQHGINQIEKALIGEG